MYRIVIVGVLVASMGNVVVSGQSADPQQSTFRVYLPLIVTPATPLTNLSAITATYLGAAGADELNGAALAQTVRWLSPVHYRDMRRLAQT